jgi:hypothetical protein
MDEVRGTVLPATAAPIPTLWDRNSRLELDAGQVLYATLGNTCTTAVVELTTFGNDTDAPDGAVYVVSGREDADTLSELILRVGDSRLIAGSPNKKSSINESTTRNLTLPVAKVMLVRSPD